MKNDVLHAAWQKSIERQRDDIPLPTTVTRAHEDEERQSSVVYFWGSHDAGRSPTTGHCILYYGKNKDNFIKAFCDLGRCFVREITI